MSQQQIEIFGQLKSSHTPLASQSRPTELTGFMGQPAVLQRVNNLNFEKLPHIVFFGPPGCGKTTLAQILAKETKKQLFHFNAVLGGLPDLRKIIKEAELSRDQSGEISIIFIDEIHRFNKGQQDALLPYLENGDFILFGATTENPNTSLNKAILSRIQKWRLEPLRESDILTILENACNGQKFSHQNELIKHIAKHSNGDARSALNQLEIILQNQDKLEQIELPDIIQNYLIDTRRYDKDNERHYDVISAFIKSVRGSDVDAAILWLAVMLDGGEDIEFIARRLIILASEDVGNADPRALQVATSAHYGIKNIGMPEARIILAQATTYLANAPKSNASYRAIDKALAFIRENPTIEVPTHLRNHHPDKKNYKYPHSFENHWTPQEYHPGRIRFYESSHLGYEKMQEDYLKRIKSH